MSSQVMTQPSTQYAMKKRKKPKPRTKTPAAAPVKSNPSKRHRDRLNAELERLSQLIPLPPDVVNKLDKLSILRLSVAYLRNKSYSKHIDIDDKPETKALLPVNRNQPKPAVELSESELALQALDGFIMVVTQDFNVLYITTNVQDCLGFPQSDVMYQSMLDLIHADDRKQFMKQMMINPMGEVPEITPEDGDPPAIPDYVKHGLNPEMVKELSADGLLHRSFICRLRCLHDTSSGFLALHFTGHLALVPGQNRRSENGTLLPPELGLFLLASPLQTPSILEIRTKNYIFRTKHKLDYTPLGIDQKGRIVLGYTEQELRQQSGYQFIHSADMMHCADAHTKLMRKGQSGLTVFRLLHRANRWQWVTASARLIYSKGVPEYIISTHRPITEQEGEEHLKKRSNAFRFDFTGHASLYASVNPIGAGPPPTNSNRSYGSSPEVKPHINGPTSNKRQRMSNAPRQPEVDPATLWGAQTFQSMDNYPDGLPIIKSNDSPINVPFNTEPSGIVKSEPSPYGSSSDMGYFKASPGGVSGNSPHYSTNSPDNASNSLGIPNSGNADSGYSDNDYQLSPAYNRVLESLYEGADPEIEPPPLHHPPISETNVADADLKPYQAQGAGYNPQAQCSLAQGQAWAQQQVPSRLLRPQMSQQGIIKNHVGINNHVAPQMPNQQQAQVYNQQQAQTYNQQQAQAYNQQQPPQGSNQQYGQGPQQHTLQNGVNHHQQHEQQYQPRAHQQAAYPQINHHHQQQQPRPVQQQQLQNRQQYPQMQQPQAQGYPTTRSLVEQMQAPTTVNGYQHYQGHTTSRPRDDVNILNSLEISSTISKTGDAHKEREMQELLSMLGPSENPNVNPDQFEVSLECQETTIQFDMDRIAAEYQTINPLGVIRNYVQNNPTDAIAIATGNMPEARVGRGNGINRVPPNTPSMGGPLDQYNSCTFDQTALAQQNGQINHGYMPQPTMNAHNPIASQNQTNMAQIQPGMPHNPQMVQNSGGIGHKGIGMRQGAPRNQHMIQNAHGMGHNGYVQGKIKAQVGHAQQMGQTAPPVGQNVPGMGHKGMNHHHQLGMNTQNNTVNIKTEEDLGDINLDDLLSLDIPTI